MGGTECCSLDTSCSCDTGEIFSDFLESQKVVQFLMGLNEEYNHTKDQILLMDPLPQLSQLYSMLLKVEKQRNNGLVLIEHMNTLLAKMSESQFRFTAERSRTQSHIPKG